MPSTARGKFDCSYSPRTGILDITVRLCPTFGGGFFESFRSDEQETIRRNLIESVPVYWRGRCTFRCTRHGWTDIVVRPVFSVEIGGGNSHFKMIVSHEDEKAKKNPHGRECRGFVSMNQVESPGATDRLELRDFQTREFNHTVGVCSRPETTGNFWKTPSAPAGRRSSPAGRLCPTPIFRSATPRPNHPRLPLCCATS